MRISLLISPTQLSAPRHRWKGRTRLSIRVSDLVAFIQDGVAPADGQQLSSLEPQLVVGRQQDAVLALSHQPDELPAPHQPLTSSDQPRSRQCSLLARHQLRHQHLPSWSQ